jgi:translocation and assembly module TamB
MIQIRIFLRFSLWLAALLGTAFLAIYAYLRSDAGMDRLAREISTRASSEESRITLSGLRGNLFGDITLARLEITDQQGTWLETHDLRIHWSPRALLRQQPPLARVEAGTITIFRKPLPSPQDAADDSEIKLAELREYASYLPGHLTVRELLIAEPVAGIAQRLTLQGAGNPQSYALKLNTLEGVPLSLEARLTAGKKSFATEVTFHEAEGGLVAALLALPNDTALSLEADLASDHTGKVTIHAAHFQAGTLGADARGTYNISSEKIDLTLDAIASDLTVVQALSSLPMSGSAEAKLTLQGILQEPSVTLEATTPHLVIQHHRLTDARFKTQATLTPFAWDSNAFHANGMLQAQGIYNGQAASLQLEGMATNDRAELARFSATYGNSQLTGKGSAIGTPALFDLVAELALKAPEGSSTLTLKGTVDREKARYSGHADGSFQHLAHRFDIAAELTADAAEADISTLSLKGPGVTLEGSAQLDLEKFLADASLQLQASDLSPLGELTGQTLSGMLMADITLNRSGTKQAANVSAKAQKLFLPGLYAEDAALTLKSTDAKMLEALEAALSASGISAASVSASTLEATAKGSLINGLDLSARGKGALQSNPWQLAVTGSMRQPEPQRYEVNLATLEGVYAQAPITLKGPTRLLHQPDLTRLSPFTLQVADGSLQAEGLLENSSVSGTLTLTDIALQKLPILSLPDLTLDAKLELRGSAKAPLLDWSADSKGKLNGIEVAAHVEGAWKKGVLQSELLLQSQQASAQASASLPAQWSLHPFATDLGEQTPLRGNLKAALPLSILNAQLRPDGHRLEGNFSGEAILAGTLGHPFFEGDFAMSGGRYDHTPTGICLRDMQARITGSQQAIRLEEFSAQDRQQKRLTATGALTLTGTPTFGGEARLDEFTLFCGGRMNGKIDGTLKADGTTRAMMVAGALTLGPLSIQLPETGANSDIPEIPFEWVRPGEEIRHAVTTPSMVGLDITLSAPQRLFVRGRGLDAEFKGDLAITGTTAAPQLSGQFNKLRGTFTLLDRVLTLATTTIRFEGPIPPSPFLNMNAETRVQGNTITVSLTGNVAQPKLSLTSSPALPQDELLALLLFGRQLQSITAFEALQLAQATRTLAGFGGGGPGVIGTLRDALGLDRLSVGADANNNVNVTTGKYITDDVYVGVVQGARPEDREVVTEITLSPSISGKTSSDSIGNQSVGIEWKRDY